jgi:hypothetical protein
MSGVGGGNVSGTPQGHRLIRLRTRRPGSAPIGGPFRCFPRGLMPNRGMPVCVDSCAAPSSGEGVRPLSGYNGGIMLTRSAVAKRLKCSIATVRRLEGHDLFPRRDSNGVHRFDESEVAEVARRLVNGDAPAAKGSWLRGSASCRTTSRVGSSRTSAAMLPGERTSFLGNSSEMVRLRRQMRNSGRRSPMRSLFFTDCPVEGDRRCRQAAGLVVRDQSS